MPGLCRLMLALGWLAASAVAPGAFAVTVSGTVVDDATGEPVEVFVRRVCRHDPHWPHIRSWQDHLEAAGRDGGFVWDWPRAWWAFRIRIEAEGYHPAVSRVIRREEENPRLTFRLKPAAATTGTVRGVDGEPAEHVSVLLATVSRRGRVSNGMLFSRAGDEETLTDADGVFRLPPETDPCTIVAASDEGYAIVTMEDPGEPAVLTLEPWSRLEGRLLDPAGRPMPKRRVVLRRTLSEDSPYVTISHRMTTDERGRFEAGRVPPGTYQFFQPVVTDAGQEVWLMGRMHWLELRAGETVAATLGGRGRPVTGRVVLPAGADRADAVVTLQLQTPHWNHGRPIDFDGYRQLVNSEAGRAYRVEAPLDADGRFRVERLPPGRYRLLAPRGVLAPRAKFTIDLLPGGESDEPLDLGEVVLRALPVAGQAGP